MTKYKAFTMQELFQNKKLSGVLPQFYKKDGLKNVYSFAWVEDKVFRYLRTVFGGRVIEGELIIRGKQKEKLKEIERLKSVIENLFNNIPTITKNIRKNTQLLLPVQSVDKLRGMKTMEGKLQVMEWVLENVNYNPMLANNSQKSQLYRREQQKWIEKVGGKR